MISRFGVGWLLGGTIIMVYHELRPSLSFWPFILAAIILTVVGGHLAEKHLAK